jgi:hypothetical protein
MSADFIGLAVGAHFIFSLLVWMAGNLIGWISIVSAFIQGAIVFVWLAGIAFGFHAIVWTVRVIAIYFGAHP